MLREIDRRQAAAQKAAALARAMAQVVAPQQRIGTLTVLEPVGRTPQGHILWLCRCMQCRNTVVVRQDFLQRLKLPPTMAVQYVGGNNARGAGK